MQVIDFGGKSKPGRQRIEVISDDTAVAIYFSNRGTQHLLRGDAISALPWFERAVELAPDLRAVRENLAVVQRRTRRELPPGGARSPSSEVIGRLIPP